MNNIIEPSKNLSFEIDSLFYIDWHQDTFPKIQISKPIRSYGDEMPTEQEIATYKIKRLEDKYCLLTEDNSVITLDEKFNFIEYIKLDIPSNTFIVDYIINNNAIYILGQSQIKGIISNSIMLFNNKGELTSAQTYPVDKPYFYFNGIPTAYINFFYLKGLLYISGSSGGNACIYKVARNCKLEQKEVFQYSPSYIEEITDSSLYLLQNVIINEKKSRNGAVRLNYVDKNDYKVYSNEKMNKYLLSKFYVDIKENIYGSSGLELAKMDNNNNFAWFLNIDNIVIKDSTVFASFFHKNILEINQIKENENNCLFKTNLETETEKSGVFIKIAKIITVTPNESFIVHIIQSDFSEKYIEISKTGEIISTSINDISYYNIFKLQPAMNWFVDSNGFIYLSITCSEGFYVLKITKND